MDCKRWHAVSNHMCTEDTSLSFLMSDCFSELYQCSVGLRLVHQVQDVLDRQCHTLQNHVDESLTLMTLDLS